MTFDSQSNQVRITRQHQPNKPQTSPHQNSEISHPKQHTTSPFWISPGIMTQLLSDIYKSKEENIRTIRNHRHREALSFILFSSLCSFSTCSMGRHHAPNRDSADEQHAIQWIFAILGEPVPPGPFEEILRNGNVLCRFMQRIRPDLLPKFSQSEQPAKQRENISLFTTAAAAMGVPTTDLFQTIDLFEGKDPSSIAHCLARLGGILQRDRPDLPVHGPKLSEAQQKEFTTQQLAAGKMHY